MLNSPRADKALLPGKLAYSVRELVDATGVSRSAIYLEITSGRLQSIKIGRRRIIIKEQAVAWLNARQSGSDAAYQPGGLSVRRGCRPCSTACSEQEARQHGGKADAGQEGEPPRVCRRLQLLRG